MRGIYCRKKIKGKDCRSMRNRVLTPWEKGERIPLKYIKIINISERAFRSFLKN